MEFINVIPNVVKGFSLPKGSTVLLHFWGENEDLEILDKFQLEIIKEGSVPIRWQESRNLLKDIFNEAITKDSSFPNQYEEIFNMADVVVDIFMHGPSPHDEFPKDKISYYVRYIKNLFSILSKNKKLFIQVRVPTEENARVNDLEFNVYKESMLEALCVDIDKMKASCIRVTGKLYNKNKYTIDTFGDNRLSFSTKGREWYKDDGNGDIPCGEVYIAPVEESVDGTIMIPKVRIDGKLFENVLLKFKEGKLIDCSLQKLMDIIKSYGDKADVFGEFGIGLNDNIKSLIGCSELDEKMLGTVHIAIGMNSEFGGKNESRFHYDFIVKPLKITADDEIIMEGNQLKI